MGITKPGPGQPCTDGPLSSRNWGLVADATNAFLEQQSRGRTPPPATRQNDQFVVIQVDNQTGDNRRAGEVVAPDYLTYPLADLSNDYRYFGGKTFSTAMLNQFAILLEPMDTSTPRRFAPAVALGVCKAYVLVNDAAHRYARPPTDGTYVLQSCSDGPVRILYKQTGTGEKEAIVAIEHGERDGLRGIANISGATILPMSSTANGQALKKSDIKCTIRMIRNTTASGPIFQQLGSTDYVYNSTPFYFGWAGSGGGFTSTEVPVVMQDGVWMIDLKRWRREFVQSGNSSLTVMSGTYASNQVAFNAPGGNNNEWELPTDQSGTYNIDVTCKLTWGDSTAQQFNSTVALIHSSAGTLDTSKIEVLLPSQTGGTVPGLTTATFPTTGTKEATHRIRISGKTLAAGTIYLTASCSQNSTLKTPETTIVVEQIRETGW